MGWIAGTASAAFGFAYVLSTMVVLANGGVYGGGHLFTNAQFLGVLAGKIEPLTACLHYWKHQGLKSADCMCGADLWPRDPIL